MAKKGFRVKRFGNWDQVRRLAARFPEEITKVNAQSLKRVGLEAEKRAVIHLRDQDLDWEPLKEETIKRKVSKGGSEKMLIDTTTYLQSITSIATPKVAMVGVFRGRGAYKDGESVVNIARVHEYGSRKRNIPARPLWQPTMIEMNRWLKEQQYFTSEIKKHFSKNYGL